MTAPWLHRIDAVPKIGRNVEFKTLYETGIHKGTIVPATLDERRRFLGIGEEVVWQSNGCRFLANEVEYWRYDR